MMVESGEPKDSVDAAPETAPSQAAPAPVASRSGDARRRLLRIGSFALVAAIGLFFVLPKAPHDQHLRMHLGTGSSRIVHATARVALGGAGKGWDREADFRFDAGAPPSFVWSFSLPNGKAHLEVELSTKSDVALDARDVELSGDEVAVELAPTMGRLP